ncbi:unnamed protein product, partial [Urochloa humidicola]
NSSHLPPLLPSSPPLAPTTRAAASRSYSGHRCPTVLPRPPPALALPLLHTPRPLEIAGSEHPRHARDPDPLGAAIGSPAPLRRDLHLLLTAVEAALSVAASSPGAIPTAPSGPKASAKPLWR